MEAKVRLRTGETLTRKAKKMLGVMGRVVVCEPSGMGFLGISVGTEVGTFKFRFRDPQGKKLCRGYCDLVEYIPEGRSAIEETHDL